MAECQQVLMNEGKPYPRTCALCGLGPCQKGFGKGGAIIGAQSVADALAREAAKALRDDNIERSKLFAGARGCVLELFPELK